MVVGTSGTGKSNIAGYLAHRSDVTQRYLPGPVTDYCFLLLDFNGLPAVTTSNLYRAMLKILEKAGQYDPDLLQELKYISAEVTDYADLFALFFALQRAHQLLIDQAGKQLIWLFDRFEKGSLQLEADTLNSLRNLRDQFKDRLTYVAFTRAPLARLRNPAEYDEFHEIMVMHTCWVGAMNRSDGEWIASQVRERYGKTGAKLPQAAVDLLFDLCGGWPALLKVAYTAWMDGLLSQRDTPEALQAKLLVHAPFRRNCQEIWDSCSREEQALLRALATHGAQAKVRPADLHYLQQLGLVTVAQDQPPCLFAPFFTEFVRRQHEQAETGIRIEKGMVYKDGVPLPTALADLEFRLLEYFCRHADDEVCLHKDIDDYLWPGEEDLGSGDRLRAVVSRLRRKIGDASKKTPWTYIQVVHGRGYKFVQPAREGV